MAELVAEAVTSAGVLREATLTSPAPDAGDMKPAMARPANPKPAKTARQVNTAVRRASRSPGRGRRGTAWFLRCNEMLWRRSRLCLGAA